MNIDLQGATPQPGLDWFQQRGYQRKHINSCAALLGVTDIAGAKLVRAADVSRRAEAESRVESRNTKGRVVLRRLQRQVAYSPTLGCDDRDFVREVVGHRCKCPEFHGGRQRHNLNTQDGSVRIGADIDIELRAVGL